MSPRGSVLLALVVVLAGCAGAVPEPPSTTERTTGSPMATTPTSPAPTPVPATRPQVTVTVTRVVDGDTLRIRYPNGTTDTVRLLGVDTPETYGETSPAEFEGVPDTEAGRACLADWAERATRYVAERLDGRTVRLGFDPAEGRRGYYGRLLAYVWTDGTQFNYGLLRHGYARLYDSDFVERARYAAAEDRARDARRGLWTCTTPTTSDPSPTDVGSTTAESNGGSLAVSVHPDAAGNDHENLNDEYVTLTNTGDATVDLTGWTIADEAGHTYTFEACVLAPNESVTLYTGSGTDTRTDRYWGRHGAVWNNGGDTVIVRNGDGDVVREYRYEG